MIGRLMGSTVLIIRTGVTGKDRLNNPIRGEVARWSTPARLTQDTTSERDGSDVLIDKWRGYFPRGTDLRASDRVLDGNREFSVEGTPSFEGIPGLPGADHVSASLRYVGEVL